MAKFGIITVCYNAEDTIEATIRSVLSQTYTDYEYVIIDGASTDGTLDIIKKYADGGKIRYISEPDDGLYYAMNKGVEEVAGDYIEILNAGDELAGDSVLEAVASYIDKHTGSKNNLLTDEVKRIFYGNIIYMYPDGSNQVRTYGKSCGKAIYYATGDCVNHQAIFASKECFDTENFDAKNLKICADRDWMMRVTRSGAKWIATGITVVKYDLSDDSVSVRDSGLLKKEERICIKRHYAILYPIYLMFDFMRSNKVLSGVLHSVYKALFIRK